MMKFSILLLTLISIGCAHRSSFRKIKHVSEASHRSEKNIIRNTYRHPVKTLKFFDVRPSMSVVEISPGGGWYTEVLGPHLKKGELYLAIFSDKSARSYAPRLNKGLKEKISAHKELYGKIHYTVLDSPKFIGPVAPKNSVDRVLTFRNVHNWMKDGTVKKVFQEFFKVLKPGGILGVVEHRAKTIRSQDLKAKSGYVREDYVIDLARSVGFEFLAKSEINANYNDSAKHSEGVWTLPPSLRLKKKNQSKYLAIGESDRMTVKFRKPLSQ